MWFDVHTHRLPLHPEEAVLSCTMHDVPLPEEAVYLSAGIHPWYLSAGDFPAQLRWVEAMAKGDVRVVALGEAGLDKRCPTPFSLQEEAFRSVCALADQYGLPLIIHSVKASNELLALKRALRPHTPWIVHGFRGGKELALALARHGFILSFGVHYHPEALASMPEGHFLIETDESTVPVETLYCRAAQLRGTSPALLGASVCHTVDALFFNR